MENEYRYRSRNNQNRGGRAKKKGRGRNSYGRCIIYKFIFFNSYQHENNENNNK